MRSVGPSNEASVERMPVMGIEMSLCIFLRKPGRGSCGDFREF